jgi:hypothetical protein
MTDASPLWKRKLKHYWPIFPLVFIMLLLAIPELESMGFSLWESNPCDLQEINQDSFTSWLYAPLANWALRFSPTPTVAIVYLDPKTMPAGVLANTCDARDFLSSLIDDLNILQVNVIVIDKFYSNTSCTGREKNAKFLNAVDNSRAPIVVGQPTQKLEGKSKAGSCLALSERFQFDSKANVHYGLTRLNSDVLKLPLQWTVFKQTEKTDTTPASVTENTEAKDSKGDHGGDTLALVAARQQDPNIDNNSSVQKLVTSHLHPYTTFLDLPNIDAMTVLCSADKVPRDANGKLLGAACDGKVKPLNNLDGNNLKLNGKIVVIGDKSDENDMQPFPGGGEKPGVWLQANYIQSLLDHRFLREISLPITLICLVLFIAVVYALFWNLEPPVRALSVSLILLATLIVVSLAILVGTSYFTPLWALWGASVFVSFRYLETKAHHLLGHLKPEHTSHLLRKPKE